MGLGLLAATCATPAAIASLFSALFYLQVGWFADKDWRLVLDNIQLYAMLSSPVALFVTLAAGGPIAHQLAHRGHVGPGRHLLLGAALGAMPFLLFDGYIIGTNILLDVRPVPDLDDVLVAARWAVLGSWCGVWSATAYWAVAIRSPRS